MGLHRKTFTGDFPLINFGTFILEHVGEIMVDIY